MPATITGIVFNDLNHNGLFDAGEPGIPNVFVVLFSSTGGTCASTITDANGNYSFTITTAGTYTVYETVADPGLTCPPTTFTQPTGFTVSNGPRKFTIVVTAAQVTGNAVIANQNFSHDTTDNPLFCTTTMVQFSGRPTEWFNINLVTGAAISQGLLNPALEVNAIGYNPLDNYVYGYEQTTNHIVRVDRSGNVTILSPLPPGLPADGYNVGTFDLNGFLYIYVNDGTKFYVIDLRPNSATYLKLVSPASGYQEQFGNFGVVLTRTATISDWVFRPADGNLYGILPTGPVQRIVPTTGAVTSLTTTPLVTTTSFGAMAIDATGAIFAIANNTGGVYRYIISGNTATSSRFSTTVITQFNDATLCPFATVGTDFGDAPDISAGNGPGDYSTLLANNGPRHQTSNALFLGTQVTTELDALQNPTATGDDIPKGIQDDGLTVPLPVLVEGPLLTTYSLNVRVTNNTGIPANLYGWVDFNGNGIFEGFEASDVQVVPSLSGTQTITIRFTTANSLTPSLVLFPGQTFVRLRLTTDNLVNQNVFLFGEDTRSVGPASDGEVEDYILEIIPSGALLLLSKTASQQTAFPGDTVLYTFKVTNPNSFDLTNVRIEDSTLGLIDILSSLPAAASVTLEAKFVVPPNTPAGTVISNIVTGTSDQTPPANAITEFTVLPTFSLDVVKTVDRISVAPGDTVTYTLTVTNTSNAPITNVTVKDDLIGFAQVIPSLGIGETQTFTAPFLVPLGTPAGTVFTNLTTATSNETPPTSDTATIVVTPIPNVFIVKTVSPQIAAPGDTVNYTITASNAGNETLTNLRIVDPTLGIDQTFDTVEPGDSIVLTIPFDIPITAVQGDTIVNVATVTTNQTGPSQADAVVAVLGQPGIVLIKTVSPAEASIGSTVTYTFEVTNTGNTALSNVLLTDPLLGLSQTIGTIAVGDSQTITFPFVVPSGATSPFNNIATVTGSFDSQTVQDSDDASLVVLQPDFLVSKAVDQTQANPGDTVNFTLTITNTGTLTLTNVVVSDPLLSINNTIASLAPGVSVTKTIPFVIPSTAAGGSVITNVVTVTPTETPPKDATTTVTVNNAAAIAITKTPDRDNALPGELITYTITVTNTGNVDLTNVNIRDPLLSLNTVIPTLAVGQSTSLTPTFTVPADAAIGTVIINTSLAVSDQTDSVTATAKVLVNPLPPIITVVKTADRLAAAPGETVTYSITVSNLGTVVLTNVLLTDDTLGINQELGTLNPGQSQTLPFQFTIPANAPNGSVIVNTAVVVSDQTNPEEGTTTVTVDPSPSLQVTKTIDPLQAAPRQTVTATIVVQNTGNVSLTNVVITDPTLNFSSVLLSLPAGSSISIPIPFEIPSVPAGTVLTNTATATSNETGPSSSTASLTVLPALQLSLVKRVEPSVASPGETVTFTFEIRNTTGAPLTNVRFVDDFLGIDKTVDFLPADFFIILSRTFTVPADAVGGTVLTNTAVLSSDQTEPISATAEVTVASLPRLDISKTVFPPIALPGQTVFFQARGVNTGNVPLTNIRYSDPLLGLNGTVVFQDIGAAVTLIIPFTVPPTSVPGETIVNTAFVDSAQTGPLSTSVAVRVAELPITVTKKSDAERIFVGDRVKFRITVTNTGSIPANNVVLTDLLQKGTKLVPKSVEVDRRCIPDADPEKGILLGTIASGQSVQVSFEVKQVCLPPNEKVRNFASVSFQLGNLPRRFTVDSNTVIVKVEEHHE
ncbi:GEVED domain-containing protein [Paenibacillus sp. SC116]|uniref:DUF7507 domain-containing protein n=1 Tax=Paenibacillus sp. SC116 TaxID=2968986 RepID=UPI00215B6126|nr:SdrD B-like domain-containing protein [Paenibacillus sp. SC116]MCR8842103.1 GEVED domain-containing protein [Paenibacillus sp. SC116]